jgi:uridine kinase
VIVADILALPADGIRRVAVDGVDGAGKTHFADELAALLTDAGQSVIRASVDGFHHPAAIRHRRGRTSPEGFYLDSYDYPGLTRSLLGPLSPGGTGRYVDQIHDVRAERPVTVRPRQAEPGDILVFDGIFTHRDELVGYWDYSIWLAVPFEVSIPRGAARGYGHPDPTHPTNHRYVAGQRLYIDRCRPQERATVVVDNTDPANRTYSRRVKTTRSTPGPS